MGAAALILTSAVLGSALKAVSEVSGSPLHGSNESALQRHLSRREVGMQLAAKPQAA